MLLLINFLIFSITLNLCSIFSYAVSNCLIFSSMVLFSSSFKVGCPFSGWDWILQLGLCLLSSSCDQNPYCWMNLMKRLCHQKASFSILNWLGYWYYNTGLLYQKLQKNRKWKFLFKKVLTETKITLKIVYRKRILV